MTATIAPLADYVITGYDTRYYQPAPGVQLPGGTCWHCGTAIAICVQIRHRTTEETHEIGSTCAERVGLDVTELKKMLRDRYAAIRNEQAAAERKAHREATDAKLGEHGTETRYSNGCRCPECRATAPHGTVTRWNAGCGCLECVDRILEAEPKRYWVIEDYPVMVELATGRIVDAEVFPTRYGSSWCVKTDDGRKVWLAIEPARRSTHTKKGYVEARAPMLVESGRDRERARLLLGEPLVDLWGELIAHSPDSH
ncbi:hypothetical protein AB0C34_16995 [Nocardia sp. NPDC049220]|uniref:hypothetical protein n=1 Tax=Nocardia sp. NPDC049220 TaxID=3155273 RepID=UPI0033D8BCE9